MTTIRVLVTIAFVASVATVSNLTEISGIAPRISGGWYGNIPYQIFLRTFKLDEQPLLICGGSLISQFYVLTAAHCLVGAKKIRVTLGTNNIMSNEYTQISKVFKTHEKYRGNDYDGYFNDIALIKLPEPVKLTNTIKTVTLPPRNDIRKNYFGRNAIISGWGSTNILNNNFSRNLKFANVRITDNSYCEKNSTDYSVLCASSIDGKSCKGDSGGPLVVDGVQIGIFSFFMHPWGKTLCVRKYPGGYTNVSHYLDWIGANSDVIK